MIHIESPRVVSDANFATLETFLSINNKREKVWFKVAKKYESYLCFERTDAFVIAVLNYAMRNRHDIRCDAPISEDLYYNIDRYLIDALVKYNKDFYKN